MPLFVIIDGQIGVCGLAGTDHDVCPDANTTVLVKRRWYGDDGIAGRGYSPYVTITILLHALAALHQIKHLAPLHRIAACASRPDAAK